MSSADLPADAIDPLTALAIRHGTDKWGAHFYTPVYHRLFSHLRDEPIRLLEIGIGGYGYLTVGGASLQMWADYFPNGRIVAIDIAPKNLALSPRVTTLVGSQDDPAFLQRLCDEHGPFDIIIDDGSHVPQHVATSFFALFPRLADRGLYVIEDAQTTFWPQFGGSVLDGGPTMKLALSVIEFIHHAEIRIEQPKLQLATFAEQVRSLRAYHNIIVIEKGDNNEPSSHDYRLDNPHAARAVRMIEGELAHTPTPEGFANLAEVLARGARYAEAETLIAESLAKWPEHPALLAVGVKAAEMRGDDRARLGYLERLAKLEPDNAPLRRFVEQLKATPR
jgi:demethylmacrocin O-methyltransferase